MKTLLTAVAAVVVFTLAGCAGYGGTATISSLISGTEPGQGSFPSQVIGP